MRNHTLAHNELFFVKGLKFQEKEGLKARARETTFHAFALAVACLLILPSARASVIGYTVADLGTIAAHNSWGLGLNATGQVTGFASMPGNSDRHAFIYTAGVMTDLGTLGGTFSIGRSINDSGQVAGASSYIVGDSAVHAFTYSGGVMTALGTLGGTNSDGWGINASGRVTGYSTLPGETVVHAFITDTFGVMTDLGALPGDVFSVGRAINTAGQVTGTSCPDLAGTGCHAIIVDTGGVMADLGTLGGSSSDGWGINDHGQIAGYGLISGDSALHAFIYSGGVMTDISTLGGTNSHGIGINNSGQVTGGAQIAGDGTYHAFLYAGGVMTDVNPTGWSNTFGTGINDSGQIVGYGTNPAGHTDAFLLTPLSLAAPEPASLLLIGSGLVGLCGFARRRPQLPHFPLDG